MIPRVRASLDGRKALVVGIANEHSIAWGCAKWLRALGADLAVTYLNAKAKPHVEPLARELEAQIFLPLDVRSPGELEAFFDQKPMGAAGCARSWTAPGSGKCWLPWSERRVTGAVPPAGKAMLRSARGA